MEEQDAGTPNEIPLSDSDTPKSKSKVPPWLQRYVDRGFRLVYWKRGTNAKNWKGPTDEGWPTKEYDLTKFDIGIHNIGCLLGTEISPGKFLIDIDFDSPEAQAFATIFLPTTSFGWTRAGAVAHAFYTSPIPLTKKSYTDVKDKAKEESSAAQDEDDPGEIKKKNTLLEIRGVTTRKTSGFQTMLPPSIHPSGVPLELTYDGPIGHVENLQYCVNLCATAAILTRHLGLHGYDHEARLAVAGFLLELGLPEKDVTSIGEAIFQYTKNKDKNDIIRTVKDTAQSIANGRPHTGRKTLIGILGERGFDVCNHITDWFGGRVFQADSKNRIFKDNQNNIQLAFEKLGIELGYDAFASRPMINYNGYKGALQDHMVTQIWLDIDIRYQFRPTPDFYNKVLDSTARHSEYHPVKEYLSHLKWDGTPRIDTWLIRHAKARVDQAEQEEYVKAISAVVLIAAVRRVRQPGAKFDELLVLESGQGQFKSSALRTLCPNDTWFSDDLPLNADSKVVIERTRGKWIIEASDLSGMRVAQIENLKSMLSRQVDSARLSYDKLTTEYPRQWIAIGTTNSHVYLKDTTGNRRFWPLRVNQFNIETLRHERDQLWAEASHREQLGESIRLPASLYAIAELQQERRREEDPWEDPIIRYLDTRNKTLTKAIDRNKVTRDELWRAVNMPVERQDVTAQQRIASVMQILGFKKGSIWVDGVTVKGWKLTQDKDLIDGMEEEE